MKKNMGNVDRAVRTGLAVLAGLLYYTGLIGGTAGLLLAGLAVVFLLTSFISWCPAYAPFGFSTRKE